MVSAIFVSVSVAALAFICSAQPLEERQSFRSPFNLYAYGDDINGMEVFYADGMAPTPRTNDQLSNLFNRASSNRGTTCIERDQQSSNV